MADHSAVALALGSNMGESAAILQGALDSLAALPGLDLIAVSNVYRTAPVGGPEQDDYLNAVVVGRTSMTPRDLLAATQAVERSFHRERTIRWGPRTLDIDILAMGPSVVDEPDLVIPHPRAHERAFVLVPWCDVEPGGQIPGRGAVADLAAAIDASGVQRDAGVLRIGGAA